MGNSSHETVEVGYGSQDEKKASRSALDGPAEVTAALLVAMMVTAMEQLVVSPAMPTIIAQLEGIRHLSLGHFGLSAGRDRQYADLWEAGRHVRSQASSALRTCALQPGLDPVRDRR